MQSYQRKPEVFFDVSNEEHRLAAQYFIKNNAWGYPWILNILNVMSNIEVWFSIPWSFHKIYLKLLENKIFLLLNYL